MSLSLFVLTAAIFLILAPIHLKTRSDNADSDHSINHMVYVLAKPCMNNEYYQDSVG